MRAADLPDRQHQVVSGYGLDPGTKECGLAYVQGGEVKAIGVIRKVGSETWSMPATIQYAVLELEPAPFFVIENQQAYGRGKSDPNDLIRLAHVAGAAAASAAFRAETVYFPLPRTWKQGMPKGAHQAKFLDELGWSYTFDGPKRPVKDVVVPEGVHVIGKIGSNWSEVVDAMALAMWGYEQKLKEPVSVRT